MTIRSQHALCTGRKRPTLGDVGEPKPGRQRGLPCTMLGRKARHHAQGQTPLTQASCPRSPHSHPSPRAPAQQPTDRPHPRVVERLLLGGTWVPTVQCRPGDPWLARRGHSNGVAAGYFRGFYHTAGLGASQGHLLALSPLNLVALASLTPTFSLSFLTCSIWGRNDQDSEGMASSQASRGAGTTLHPLPGHQLWQGQDPHRGPRSLQTLSG